MPGPDGVIDIEARDVTPPAPAATRAPARGIVGTLKAAVSGWIDDGGPQQGAAIAYYTIFAIAPLMLIVLTIAGLVFGDDAARGQVFDQIAGLVGAEPAAAIQSMLASTQGDEAQGVIGAVLSAATALLGASAVFVSLKAAFDAVFHPGPAETTRSAVTAFMRARLVSIALVLGMGFLVVVTLLLSAGVAALGAWLGDALPALAPVMAIFDVALSTAVLTLAFWGLIRFLPQQAPRAGAIWTGAFASAVMFSIGKHLIGLYLARGAVASAFGAAGSLIVVVVWVYYSAQILLLGAELARAIDDPARRRG